MHICKWNINGTQVDKITQLSRWWYSILKIAQTEITHILGLLELPVHLFIHAVIQSATDVVGEVCINLYRMFKKEDSFNACMKQNGWTCDSGMIHSASSEKQIC